MNNNFIFEFNLENLSLCDDLIKLYQQSNKRPGLIKNTQGNVLDKSIKD